jgi:hypothetical protein
MSSSAVSVTSPLRITLRKKKGKKKSKTEVHRAGDFRNDAQFVVEPKFPMRGSFDNQPYNLIQTLNGITTTISSSNLGSVFGSANFSLGQVDQNASLGNVFDQYRIVMIEATFMPAVSQESTAAANLGIFYSCIDYDDSTNLTTIGQITDFQNCVAHPGYQGMRRTFRPHAAVAAYSGAFTSFANEESPWLDSASGSIQHYGLKWAWSATTTNSNQMSLVVRAWFQFRNVR